MPHQITIKPSNHTFSVSGDETILDGALREGFHIAYGCRDGACGSCKGKLLEGRVEYGEYSDTALTDEDKENGYALFCQAKPLSDVIIECREISAIKDIPVRVLPCRVQKLEKLAPDVMMIHLRLPANERLQFLAGQYIDILTKAGLRRSLSLANPPHDDAMLQLHLRNYGGPFSQYVFGTLKEKDILRFEGPLGTFFLREDSDKPIILLASGTGFAPIKAIIEHAIHNGIQRPMTLYWGCRVRDDLYLNGLAEGWAREHGVRYIPVLSDAKPEDNWTGRSGFVHRAVMEDFPDMSSHQVYACGAPIVIESARHDFIGLCKLPAEEFFCDSFTPAAQ
ncbi:MAG: CDP-6-deoxy-delta-3,4-glucoseen reductase [Betaproteobacteria bacterium]|nr:CDP-6-deoxy-delta-3,4-glucoseen reductase [Betaproteobacteria bacterium]